MNGVDSVSHWGGLHPPEKLDLNTRKDLEFFAVEQSGTRAYQPAHCLHSEAVTLFFSLLPGNRCSLSESLF